MIAGRIGKDGRVHRVVKFAVPSGRALARCGRAGRAALVMDGMVSCCECLSRVETRHGASLHPVESIRGPTRCACGCEVLSRGA